MALSCMGVTQQAESKMKGHLNNINVWFAQAVMEDMDVAEVYSPPRMATSTSVPPSRALSAERQPHQASLSLAALPS